MLESWDFFLLKVTKIVNLNYAVLDNNLESTNTFKYLEQVIIQYLGRVQKYHISNTFIITNLID